MWYDELGIVSIGAQCGGPEDGGLGDIKVDLWRALKKRCTTTYCSTINHYALILRVDGKFQKFGPESVGGIRRNRREKFIQAEVVITEKTWQGKSGQQLRQILGERIRRAMELCIARLRKDKEAIDEEALMREVDMAIQDFLAISFES